MQMLLYLLLVAGKSLWQQNVLLKSLDGTSEGTEYPSLAEF